MTKKFFPMAEDWTIAEIKKPCGENVNIFKIEGKPIANNHIWKRKNMLSRTHLGDSKHLKSYGKEMLLIIRGFSKTDEKTLFVCHKQIQKHIEKYLASIMDTSSIEFRHYGELRGVNDFEDYQSIVIFGTPSLSDEYITRMSKIFCITAEEFALWHIRSEINQAVNRLRPKIRNEPIRILIMTPYNTFNEKTKVNSYTPDDMFILFNEIRNKWLNLALKVLSTISSYGGVWKKGKSALKKVIKGGKDSRLSKIIDILVKRGYLEMKKVGRSGKQVFKIKTKFAPTPVRVMNIPNPAINEAFKDVSEDNPPDYSKYVVDEEDLRELETRMRYENQAKRNYLIEIGLMVS